MDRANFSLGNGALVLRFYDRRSMAETKNSRKPPLSKNNLALVVWWFDSLINGNLRCAGTRVFASCALGLCQCPPSPPLHFYRTLFQSTLSYYYFRKDSTLQGKLFVGNILTFGGHTHELPSRHGLSGNQRHFHYCNSFLPPHGYLFNFHYMFRIV